MKGFARFLPWAIVGLCALHLIQAMLPARTPTGEFNLDAASRLPIVDGGRVKPLDTFARTNLMLVSSIQRWAQNADAPKQPAIKWVLDVLTSGTNDQSPVAKAEVFRIQDEQILSLLELKLRPQWFRYSLAELSGKIPVLIKEANRARKTDPKTRDPFDVRILELAQHLQIYVNIAQYQDPMLIASMDGDPNHWQALGDAIEAARNGQSNPSTRVVAEILLAYREGKPEEFNRKVSDYRDSLEKVYGTDLKKADFEVFFNHFEPFYQCSVLYGLVFVLACCGWIGFSEPLNKTAFWLGVLTVVVHTWALCARMYIQGRPPVTNLYSSAVFIGWGCVILSLILERIYRNGLGNAVAGVTGVATLIIAHHLAASGDTLEMMQAVLDTNFWLATHVTIITLGYTATIVAGFLGIAFILMGVCNALTRERIKTLSQMIYGVVCFAMLLSFTGTVLGGIWADQSWGRFWGWDPKENGALMIVIWNALILHARWGGLVKQRGMANLAIAGNMVTGWSYFGTNQLGVGLHAYGFNNTLAAGLTVFWGLMGACIIVGLLPLGCWRNPEPSSRMPVLTGRKKEVLSTPS